jgi:thymidine kinase
VCVPYLRASFFIFIFISEEVKDMAESHQGSLSMIIGPMFSGKTTELLRQIKRYEIAKKRCLLINHCCDTRYGTEPVCCTHDAIKQIALCLPSLFRAKDIVESYDVIGVDEGQFFDDIEYCSLWADMGKTVIVAALDGTHLRMPFGRLLNLIPMSDSVIKLTAICIICGHDASFTMRTSEETATVVVGGADKYVPLCRVCHMSHPKF